MERLSATRGIPDDQVRLAKMLLMISNQETLFVCLVTTIEKLPS